MLGVGISPAATPVVLGGGGFRAYIATPSNTIPSLVLDFKDKTYGKDTGSGLQSVNVHTLLGSAAAGNRTVVDSDGLIKWAPHNLFTYSEQFDNAAWTKASLSASANTTTAPDGTTTADTLTEDSTTSRKRVTQVATVVAGATYTLRASGKAKERESLYVLFPSTQFSSNRAAEFNLSTGVVSAVDGTADATISVDSSGFYLCELSVPCTAAGAATVEILIGPSGLTVTNPSYTGDGASGIYLWGAHLYRSDLGGMQGNGTARPLYNKTEASAFYGVRIDHDPVTLAVKGLLVEESRTNLFLNSGAPVTQTITLAATGNHVLWINGSGSATVAAGTATITGAGAATDGTPVVFNCTATGTVSVTISGSPTRCQLEKGDFAASYIPTFAATVTRVADAPSLATSAFAFNTSAGTISVRATSTANVTAMAAQLDDGTSANRIMLYRLGTDRAQFQSAGGTNQANIDVGLTADGVPFTLVGAFRANDFAASLDGAAVVSDTIADFPTGIYSTLRVGVANSGLPFQGHISRLVYYGSRLPNPDLATLSGAA